MVALIFMGCVPAFCLQQNGLNHMVELISFIEATDNIGMDIFGGYIRSKAVESVIHEYAPRFDLQ